VTKLIDQMYAWVTTTDGVEGVISFKFGDTYLPLVGADMQRAIQLRGIAEMVGDRTKQQVRLLRFTVRETCEVIDPL
jgi:hypothetical protein